MITENKKGYFLDWFKDNSPISRTSSCELKKGWHYLCEDVSRYKSLSEFDLMIAEIKRLRRTLMRWRNEILNYFKNPITNARTEGFNNVAKVIKKSGYGFRSFPNYRLRLLNACS